MKKLICKPVGGCFNPEFGSSVHSCISAYNYPSYIQWISKNSIQNVDYTFFIDDGIQQGLQINELKYGMILESKAYIKNCLNHITNNMELYRQHYKYIFTYYTDLVNLGPPFAYAISACLPQTKPQNKKIHEKNKLVSMLVSVTNVLPEHQHRLNYMEKYKNYMDVYGTGRRTQLDVVDYAFMDYMFSVGMENQIESDYFTDKITLPISMGTIPIYNGSKSTIEKYFDSDGILWADEIDISKDLSKELYNNMMPHIKNNFNILMNDLISFEDYIFENYLRRER